MAMNKYTTDEVLALFPDVDNEEDFAKTDVEREVLAFYREADEDGRRRLWRAIKWMRAGKLTVTADEVASMSCDEVRELLDNLPPVTVVVGDEVLVY